MSGGAQSHFEKLLWHSDEMSIDEIRHSLKQLIVQKQRWLGTFHPDSRVRCEAFRASGVEIGIDVFISIGLVVLDNYQPIVRIGDRVDFGNYVSLVAASSPDHSLLRHHPEVANSCIATLPISIEDDVWVGSGAIILPGITIGEKSIVGAGAVIREDVPPYSVVAGVPGRIIRTLRKENSHDV